jgi:hypothetical protein
MPDTYLEATEESAITLFSRGITGPVVMLNLLRFREFSDYSATPDLAPTAPIEDSRLLPLEEYQDSNILGSRD